MSGMLIFFKIVTLAFNKFIPVSFPGVKALLKLLFSYRMKPHDIIFYFLDEMNILFIKQDNGASCEEYIEVGPFMKSCVSPISLGPKSI